jgi:hypothetical protein
MYGLCYLSWTGMLMVAQVEDPRLDCAILRPMESEGDHFLAYYLTQDDESAIAFKEARFHPDFSYSDEKEARPMQFVLFGLTDNAQPADGVPLCAGL